MLTNIASQVFINHLILKWSQKSDCLFYLLIDSFFFFFLVMCLPGFVITKQ